MIPILQIWKYSFQAGKYLTQGYLPTKIINSKTGNKHTESPYGMWDSWLGTQLQGKFDRGFPTWLGTAEDFSLRFLLPTASSFSSHPS